MPQWLVVGISGITCGGKSTLANRLRNVLHVGLNMPLFNTNCQLGDVQLISQDDYFLPIDDLRHKWVDELNAINFELLSALDMKQMLSDIQWIIKGRYLAEDPIENAQFLQEVAMPATTPLYFTPEVATAKPTLNDLQWPQQNASPSTSCTLQAKRAYTQSEQQSRDNVLNILILEGFLIFNQPELLTLCDIKYHFHLPYEKCYERRRKRVYDPPDVVGYFEMCVWPFYEKNYHFLRHRPDITILNGELPVERIFHYVLTNLLALIKIKFCEHKNKTEKTLEVENANGIDVMQNMCAMDQQ